MRLPQRRIHAASALFLWLGIIILKVASGFPCAITHTITARNHPVFSRRTQQPSCVGTTVGLSIVPQQQQQRPISSSSNIVTHASKRDENDYYESLRPETSFGSESVPEGQRPVNEYLDLSNQPLFGWATRGTKGLITRLVIFYTVVFGAVCYPISGATFTQDGYDIQKLAASNVGAMFVLFVLLVRLYTGWAYIGQRLSSKVVEFEETGWYDGDWEEKDEMEMKRDLMLYTNEVKPVVDRLQTFALGSGTLLLVSIVSYNVAIAANPLLFDQYDPTVLERLAYDDKLANTAASTTGGKPAYCDSRYYSAVANGGMGCN